MSDVQTSILTITAICMFVPIGYVLNAWRNGQFPSLIEPIWLIILILGAGTIAKIVYVTLIRPVDIVALLNLYSDRILLSSGLEVIVPGILAVAIGVFFYFFGYWMNPKGMNAGSRMPEFTLDTRKVVVLSIVLLVVSLIIFAGIAADDLTQTASNNHANKRFNEIEGGAVNRFFTWKYYFFKLATVSRIGFYLLVLVYFTSAKRMNGVFFLLLLIALVNFSFSAYFGNRAHTLVSILDLGILLLINFTFRNTILYASCLLVAVITVSGTTIVRQNLLASKDGFSQVQKDRKLGYDQHEFDTLSADKKLRILSHLQCIERSEYWVNDALPRIKNASYWGKRAESIVPSGSGSNSALLDYLNKIFPPTINRNVCGDVDEMTESLSLAEPMQPRTLAALGTVERIMQGRYFIDPIKTAHIIRSFPKNIGYLKGQSLIGWLFIPIPRSVWESKPISSELYPALSSIIFQEHKNNLPPGFVAELFINFGWIGIIIGTFITGYLSKLFYNTYTANANSIMWQLVYAMVVVRFTFILMNTSVSVAILKTIIDLFPILLALYIVSRKTSS